MKTKQVGTIWVVTMDGVHSWGGNKAYADDIYKRLREEEPTADITIKEEPLYEVVS